MSRFGALNELWPYAAAIAGVFALAYLTVYRLSGLATRRGPAAWKYTSEIDQLRKLLDTERYDEAAAFVTPLLRKKDITPEFFDVAAIIAERRNNPKLAAQYWRAMQRYYPDNAWGYMRTATYLRRQGKVEQALRVVERARKIVKEPAHLDRALAEAAQGMEDWDEAIKLWARQRAASPGDIHGYLQARTCLLAVGRVAEADELLRDIALRMPANPHVIKAVAAAKKAEPVKPPAAAGSDAP